MDLNLAFEKSDPNPQIAIPTSSDITRKVLKELEKLEKTCGGSNLCRD